MSKIKTITTLEFKEPLVDVDVYWISKKEFDEKVIPDPNFKAERYVEYNAGMDIDDVVYINAGAWGKAYVVAADDTFSELVRLAVAIKEAAKNNDTRPIAIVYNKLQPIGSKLEGAIRLSELSGFVKSLYELLYRGRVLPGTTMCVPASGAVCKDWAAWNAAVRRYQNAEVKGGVMDDKPLADDPIATAKTWMKQGTFLRNMDTIVHNVINSLGAGLEVPRGVTESERLLSLMMGSNAVAPAFASYFSSEVMDAYLDSSDEILRSAVCIILGAEIFSEPKDYASRIINNACKASIHVAYRSLIGAQQA